jgi:L-threonylcarbamoyladenylate synthase
MIKIVKVQNNDYTEALERTIEVLHSNGVVVIPTDTAYGLAARVDVDEALKKVIDIKRRSPDKGLSMVVKDINQAQEFAECDDRIRRFFKALFPGSYTLLLNAKEKVSDLLTGRYRTVAVRLPDHSFTIELSGSVPYAYTVTSANVSGKPCHTDPQRVISDFAAGSVQPDLVIDAGIYPETTFSTILNISQEPYSIVRIGAVSADDVVKKLGDLV